MATVRISTVPLSTEELLSVVDGARLELEGSAVAPKAAARVVVDEALATRAAVTA